MLTFSRVKLSSLALVFLILLSLSCGGKTQEIRQKAAEQLGTAADKLGVETTPTLPAQMPTRATQKAQVTKKGSMATLPAQMPTRPTPKAQVTKKGSMATPTPESNREFILKEGEAQAVYESFYHQESDKLEKSVTPRLVTLTIEDPKDLIDLAIGKGPRPIVPDLPDSASGTTKSSWIDKDKGDSKRIPTLFPRQPKGTAGGTPPSADVTITGKLFYNDLRLNGRFDERRDPDGNPGVGISSLINGINKSCYKAKASCGPLLVNQENLLAARKVVATFWEVDRGYESKDRMVCEDLKYLGRSTVGTYGTYSLVLPNLIDDCPDGNPSAEIAVMFRLKFCNEDKYCFQLDRKNEKGQRIYQKYHRDAKPWNPLIVSLGSTHDLVDEKFGGDLSHDIGKEWAIAANHYATLVDAMHVLHDDAEIPFRFNEYGGLVVYMCSGAYKADLSDTEKEEECFNGRAYGTSNIGTSEPFWPLGPLMAHEYGHIIDGRTGYKTNCRAWGLEDCHYGRQPDDEIDGYKVNSWSATSYEYPYAALIEGWGSFVSRAVMETCDDIEENSGAGEVQPNYTPTKHTGNGYVRNVTKLLCDWYDEHPAQDDDAEMIDHGVDRFPGYGDRFEASLWSIWHNLDKSTPGENGKNICEYVRYYIEERKGSARVGQDVHDYYKDRIVNLIYNNGLECGYKAPESKTAYDLSGAIKNAMVCSVGPNGRKECD